MDVMTRSDPLISPALIDPEELKGRLGASDLAVIDATWTYPGGPQPRAEGHIPGAVALDIDAVADRTSGLPHSLPSPRDFDAFARAAGVCDGDEVVVYDRMGIASAPRGWWMFTVMGAARARVLDGGLPGWIAAGGELRDAPAPAPPAPQPGDFHARLDGRRLAALAQVVKALEGEDVQVLDVRSAARFAGLAAEPRPGVRAGHMPGSLNTPWTDLVTPKGRMKPPKALRAALERGGLTLERPVITSCGSGVTACAAALALEILGCPSWAVYDGSWAEWGGRADTPVVGEPAAAT